MSQVLAGEKRADVAAQGAPSLSLRLAIFGTGAWLFAAPLQFSNHPPTDYNFWPQALALLYLCAVALCLALSPVKWPSLRGTSGLLLAFGGWSLAATLLGVYKHDAWLELSRISGGLLLYFALRALPARLSTFVWCAVLGASVQALGALLDFSQTRNLREMGGFFPFTFSFLNANLFAAMLAPALMLSVLLPLEVWRRGRKTGFALLAGVPALVLTLALALTSSKGGFVAAFVAGIVLCAAIWRARKTATSRLLRRAWPVLLVAVVVIGGVAGKTVGKRLLQTRGSDDNSTQFRAYLWRSTVAMANARPLAGFGPGAFPTVYPRFALVGYTRTAHQSWLQIAAESGWPSLVLLLGAFAFAVRDGWRKLKTANWAQAACGLATLTALFVHGFFDAGWSVMCVLALVSVALALCANDSEVESSTERRGLNLPFLGATLVLLLGGYGTQQVATGEDLRALAEDNVRRRLPQSTAFDAVEADEGSARSWNFLGRVTPLENREAWTKAFETAARLQPDSAAHPREFARHLDRLPAPTSADLKQISSLYDRAVELDPLNSSLRLERGKWRLDHKDGRGFDDLEFVLKLWDEPYGKFPALGRDTDINLDFARATLALAPRLKQQNRWKTLQKRALEDCAAVRALQKSNAAMIEAMAGRSSAHNFADLDELENGLRAAG